MFIVQNLNVVNQTDAFNKTYVTEIILLCWKRGTSFKDEMNNSIQDYLEI